jgi:hypothetical protein
MMKYTFYTDPGHGWLKVSMGDLKSLGIENAISGCSYVSRNGRFAYLEEDMDAGTFMRAFENTFGYKPQIVEEYDEKSPIRSLPSYPEHPGWFDAAKCLLAS